MVYMFTCCLLFRDQEFKGATNSKIDPDAKKKHQDVVEYADLKFDNSQPKPPPPQSKKEVEMVMYADVDFPKRISQSEIMSDLHEVS